MRRYLLALLGAVLFVAGSGSGLGGVMISEFMAINDTTLADEDGAYSDWIELYNSGTNTVNLGGWYLANRATNLTQWSFPPTNLAPNAFLVVFASNKDRRAAGAPLHTNFKLSGSGEYLALVMPDGVTKTSEYAPAFPQQYPDISYGYAMTSSVATLAAYNAGVRASVPTSDTGNSWQYPGFDDSAWLSGTLGVGYDISGNYAPAIGLDLRSQMIGMNSSAYIRVPFNVAPGTPAKFLSMSVRYDDGFVAYLNGNEVLRRNAPAFLAWNSTATASHGVANPGTQAQNFEGSPDNFSPVRYGAGPVPAVQAPGPGTTGQFLRLLFDGVSGGNNSICFRQDVPGMFDHIIADFDFRITSIATNPAEGFAFMLIPTSLYGTNGAGVNITAQAVEKPNYAGVFGIGFSVYPHAQVNDISVHWDGAQQTNVTAAVSSIDLAAGVFHHVQVTLQSVTGGARVTVALTPNINGTPGTTYLPVTNFFIPGLNPFDCRAQFGGRTSALSLGLDLDNCRFQFVPPQGLVVAENFDISPAANFLVSGSNVLAVQGLNVAPGNSNFLIQPQLFGRNLVMAGPATYLYPPTPGSWNRGAASTGTPSPVTFWPPPGVYSTNGPVLVTLASSPLATIRYTSDGSTPGNSSPVYSNGLVLTNNTTIRARADLAGVPSALTAANYIFIDSTLTNFSSNLPLVIIDTLGQSIPDGSKIGSYAVFIDTNTPSGRTVLTGPANYLGRMGIGLHGSSSLGFPKQPYTIELDDEAGSSLDYPLLGLPEGSDWLLYPSYDDKTFSNNVLTEWIFAAMGHYSVRCKFTELFLRSTPGKLTASDYAGIYILIERIRVASNRVDIAKLGPTDNLAPAVTGGYLLCKDRVAATDLAFTTSSGEQLLILEPKSDKITQSQYDYVTGYVNAFEASLYGADWLNPTTGYANFIDTDSFVDQHWIVEYSKNIDGYRLSNYMNKDRNGKLKMEPIWDWDLSWGNANYADGGHTNGWYYPLLSDLDDIWLSKLRTDPDFYQHIIDRWGALRLGVFHPTNLFARIDQITNLLWEAQARDFTRWPRLGTYVWPNPDGATGGWDVDYVHPRTYAGIIDQFKHFVQGRYLWIDQQYVPAPTVTTNAATLSLSAPLGSIYYTLDNSDPRASGGGLSPAAHLYSSLVLLTNNAGIIARALYTNAWSPPARALYVASLPSLRITEINYHPAAPPSNSPYTDKDFEFIEIQNTGTNIINLAGVRLGGGIDFTFAPYQWLSVGSNTSTDFEGGGTPYTASALSYTFPGIYLTNDGPTGNLLSLLYSTTNTTRDRLAFNQTAPGPYNRFLADFDFRATIAAPAGTNGGPTIQDFTAPGTPYTLTHYGPTAPTILPSDGGSPGNFLRLVPASGGESGTVAFDRSAAGAFNSIVASFDFRITPPSGGAPADGFGFALLSTSQYGTNGAGPSFSEEPSLPGSIGIGFDDYNNASTLQEPNNNHISLHWNGVQIGNAISPSFMMSNGRFHRAQVQIWFFGGNAYVTVRLTPDIYGTPGLTECVVQNAMIPGATPYQGRVAFGARTGGAWAAHDLANINVQFSPNEAASGDLSLLLLPVGQFGTFGPGTTLASFTDWPRVTNTLALDLAFSPAGLANDASLYWNAALAGSRSLPLSTMNLAAGVFHHVRLELDAANFGALATLTLTPNSLGAPGAPITVFSNAFLPGALFGNARLEFAGRNGGLYARVDLDNITASALVLAPLLLLPGESIVVVHNQAAFISRYGDQVRIAGEFSGSLANEGDRLTLLGPVGEPILDFTYDPAWYPITDGGGFSLVAADLTTSPGAWGLPQNWRPSSHTGGSPGNVDPLPPLAELTATKTASQMISLAWPAASGNFTLYCANTLGAPNEWTIVTNSPNLAGEQWQVALPLAEQAAFYRLIGQRTSGP